MTEELQQDGLVSSALVGTGWEGTMKPWGSSGKCEGPEGFGIRGLEITGLNVRGGDPCREEEGTRVSRRRGRVYGRRAAYVSVVWWGSLSRSGPPPRSRPRKCAASF